MLVLAACAAPTDPPSKDQTTSPEASPQNVSYETSRVQTIQRRLTVLGYDAGPIDGTFGPKTRAGIRAFQRDRDLKPTGEPSASLLAAVKSAPQSDKNTGPNATQAADNSDNQDGARTHDRKADTAPTKLRLSDNAVETTVDRPIAHATPDDSPTATNTTSPAPTNQTPESGQATADPQTSPRSTPTDTTPDAKADNDNVAAPGNNAPAQQSDQRQADTDKQATPQLSEIDLTGTRWRLSGGPSQSIIITLGPDGRVEAPVGNWSWQRDGRKVRLSFDSGTRSRSTRTGKLVARDRIEGTGQDSFGRSWSWQARRISQSAANR
ncbi:peptidoglycan-binding domain-containing protein [Rhodovibrio salinarum]|nr:peptidoglycan-binding domain-containing protein [Rhodovibrio salinarum]